jgi:hypothetical protein
VLIGNGTRRAAQALTYFNNGNARIGVGTSSTAEVDTNTALTGRRVQGDGRDVPAAHGLDGHGRVEDDHVPVDVRVELDANQAWNEWGIDNGTRLLNRKVAANGTKASGQTWQFTVTVALA